MFSFIDVWLFRDSIASKNCPLSLSAWTLPCLNLPWTFLKPSLILPWTVPEPSLNYPCTNACTIHEPSMNCPWTIPEPSMNLSELSLNRSWTIPELSLKLCVTGCVRCKAFVCNSDWAVGVSAQQGGSVRCVFVIVTEKWVWQKVGSLGFVFVTVIE